MSHSCPVCSGSEFSHFATVFDRLLHRPEQPWQILQCRSCRFGWTWPPIPEHEIGSYYPSAYLGDTLRTLEDFRSGRLQRSRSWKKETEKVRLVEAFASGGDLLDVGCADGKFLWALDAQRWRRTGVDVSGPVIEAVRAQVSGINFLTGDLYHEDLKQEGFDVITLWHVLEHLHQPQRAVARLADLLRPGGWLFVSLPHLDSLQARLFRQHWYAFDDVPRHLFHYSRRALENLLQAAGLQVAGHRFFSRIVNFHCLKYSLINWSESRAASRIPYYALKPLLFGFPLLERLTGKYGMLTTISQKPP